LAPNLLIYGTGGLAYGSATATTEISQHATGPNGLPPSWTAAGTYSETRFGWTAGVGGEWMVTAHWTAKIEYLHYDLGSVTYGLNPLVTNAVVAAPCSSIHSELQRGRDQNWCELQVLTAYTTTARASLRTLSGREGSQTSGES
jgi:opacity protein-like surface antigen